MDQTTEAEHKVRRVGRPRKIVEPIQDAVEAIDASAMNDLAARIWEGQSVSADETWRVSRVLDGLKSHGYSDFAGLVLPVENIGKHL